jgi:hypothetical protein
MQSIGSTNVLVISFNHILIQFSITPLPNTTPHKHAQKRKKKYMNTSNLPFGVFDKHQPLAVHNQH